MKRIFNFQNLTAVALLVSSVVFLAQYTHFFDLTEESLGKYFNVKWLILSHIITAACALLIGPFQFLKGFRNRNLKLHRLLGKIYFISIMAASLAALALTFKTTDQVSKMYSISLWFLILVWVASVGTAYWAIRQRNIGEHEEWTVRSYIITINFLLQNYFYKIPIINGLGTFAEVFPHILWFSWAVPLFGYQVYLTFKKVDRRISPTVPPRDNK
jgi:uncharacterized membrane protein